MKTFRNITIIALTVALAAGLSSSDNGFLPTTETDKNPSEQIIKHVFEQTQIVPDLEDTNAAKNVAEETLSPTEPLTQQPTDQPVAPAPAPSEETLPEPTQEAAVAPPVTAPAPVQKRPAPAPVPAVPKPVTPAPPVAPAPAPPVAPAPAPAPAPTDQAWVDATMAKYGVHAPAGTQFIFGPMPESCAGADGCTVYSYRADGIPFNIQITLRPGLNSEYLLFHEIGHAKGIRDECEADNFSRSVVGPVQGHYC